MARILIDCSHLDFSSQPTGIPRVVLKYIEEGYAWAKTTGNDVIPVTPTPDGLLLYRPVPGIGAPEALMKMMRDSELNDARGPKAVAPPPHLLNIGPNDVLFAPSYWHDNDPKYYYDARKAGAKVVILIHDILPITNKQHYPAPWRYSFAAALLHAIDYADELLCVSRATLEAVTDFAFKRGRTLPPINVAYNGYQNLVPPFLAKAMAAGRISPHVTDAPTLRGLASEKPLLMVGTVEPKKGHIPVIKTLEAMWDAGYERNLIIVGRSGWMEREIVDYIDRSPYRGTKLFWLTGLDDHDLAYVYNRSHTLVFASIAEGFGIPMIEAALFKRPVVVLDTPIAREILGDFGSYFDDSAALIRQLIALEDPGVYANTVAMMGKFEWPTWHACVPIVMNKLAALAGLQSESAAA